MLVFRSTNWLERKLHGDSRSETCSGPPRSRQKWQGRENTQPCRKEESATDGVALEATVHNIDARIESVVVGARPSRDAHSAEKGNNW